MNVIDAADYGTSGWRAVAGRIQAEKLDHADMHELGRELSETLRAIESVARELAGQVERYGDGRVLRDDEGEDPALRLCAAEGALQNAEFRVRHADRAVQRFWSAIGHIAVADTEGGEGE